MFLWVIFFKKYEWQKNSQISSLCYLIFCSFDTQEQNQGSYHLIKSKKQEFWRTGRWELITQSNGTIGLISFHNNEFFFSATQFILGSAKVGTQLPFSQFLNSHTGVSEIIGRQVSIVNHVMLKEKSQN